MEGEFTDLHLLCLMHADMRQFAPDADTGTGLDNEYDVARAISGNKP